MRRILDLAFLVLFAVFVSSTVLQAENLKLKISFASPYATYCSPYLIAKDFGWFKDAGLDTEDIILNGDANATRALVTGASDIAMTGPLNVFNAIENGATIKWIGSWQTSVDYVVVAQKSITSLDQLQDKTFASSGPSGLPQVLPVMLFKKLGVPSDRVKFVSVGGHSARLQAVIAGKADAAIVNELTGLIGNKNGTVHILASVTEHFPHLGYIVLAARNADIADPQKLKAFEILMSGSIRGARFIQQNPEKAAVILEKYLKGIDLDLLTVVLKKLNDQKVWPLNGGLDDQVTNFTAKLEYELGETKTLFKPDQVTSDAAVKAALVREGRVP
jgi:ABC-type nitrate/sulfonate/bicarbonate transport system substrate-binding protein